MSAGRNRWPLSRLRRVAGILAVEVRRWREPAVGKVSRPRRDPFLVLVSCIISLRTKDEVTAASSRRLFALASNPKAMLKLSAARIGRAIYPAGFYKTKAGHIRGICRDLLSRHGGKVPADEEALLALKGVGRKTANLVLGLGFGKPAICVDTHVHRISNRLGLVRTRSPEETEAALRRELPQRYWVKWNDWLVAYGQNLCHPVSPWCSRCRLRRDCSRRGVVISR